jgi:integrase/recombinase XerC
MARVSEGAWYRSSKDAWYATIDGRSISLGVKGRKNRKAAQEAFFKRLGEVPKEEPRKDAGTVAELIAAFIADATVRLKPATLSMYRSHLHLFGLSVGKVQLHRLTPSDVSGWLAFMEVSDTTKAMRLRSVSACLGWGVRNGWLDRNPVERVSRPKSRSRSELAIISNDDHARLLAVASPEFGLVLRVLHGTGCRPGEIPRITAERFYPQSGLIRLNEHKADSTGRPRLIYLTPDLINGLQAQLELFPSGPLLRSRDGRAWTARSITEAMRRVRTKAGVRGAIAYGYRHALATDGLASGLPEAHVAELLGHSSTAMLHKHYAHLSTKAGLLRQAAALVRPSAIMPA